MFRPFARATLVAGTLDILAAIGLTLFYGRRSVADMLRFVASGPFPDAPTWGTAGAALGLVVHFALMAAMVWGFLLLARHRLALLDTPWRSGLAYGIVTYVAMNLIVVPLRFGGWPPKPVAIATQLFCHVVLVGIPIALIAAGALRDRAAVST